MATRAAKAAMDAEAQQRLRAATSALAERFGAVLPPPPVYVRDPEHRAIDERTWLASALESILDASTPTEAIHERPRQGGGRRAQAA